MKKSVVTLGLVALACVSLWGCKGNSVNTNKVATSSNIENSDIESVRNIVKRAYANSLYCSFNIDESLDLSMIYDTEGRAYVESDYINGFYITKTKSLVASYDSSNKPYWEILDEYTPLYCVEKALSLAESDKANISKYDGEEGDTVYQIDVKGSNIREFFDELGKQVSDDYCKFLFNKDSLNLTDLDMINIYVMNSVENTPVFKMDIQTSDGVMTVWNLTGLFEAGAITFDSGISNIKNGDNFEDVSSLLDKEKEKIGEALTKYVESHPDLMEKLNMHSIDTSEVNESSETSESSENSERLETSESK